METESQGKGYPLVKTEGGLRFKDFELLNLAFLAKQAWRLLQEPDSLWANVMRGIYFPGQNFLTAKKGRDCSSTWMSILQGREHILRNGQWIVGNDMDINIWKDKWLSSSESLYDYYHRGDIKVNTLIDHSSKTWKMDQVTSILPSNASMKVLQTPISYTT